MLILTNGLTDVQDEGFLKVANSLVKRLKAKGGEQVTVVTYDRKADISDQHLKLNKYFFNRKLRTVVSKTKERVLFVPFPAKPAATALRTFMLSLFAKGEVSVAMVQRAPLNRLAKLLFKLSRAKLLVFSGESAEIYQSVLGKESVQYLKTGIDVERFCPVSAEKKQQLKEKYGLDGEKPIILHVGHLKEGRNIAELLKISENYNVVLVVSTKFKDEQDEALRQRLLDAPNVTLIDYYLPEIEEIYQLSDVYFFPVVESGNCIDVPLSCLEAAACDVPVITTRFGEMREFEGKNGFLFIDSFEKEEIDKLIKKALAIKSTSVKEAVLEYDWNCAVDRLHCLN